MSIQELTPGAGAGAGADAGDHTLVLGLVLRAEAGHDGEPLVYHAGAYRRP